jgi:hypothetical protein
MEYRRLAAVAAAAVLCLLPASCGSDDDGRSDAATTATFEITESGSDRVSISGPKRIPAGLVEITLRNSGNGPHGGQIVRVEGKRSHDAIISGSVDQQGSYRVPDWITDGGGIGVVPGDESATVMQVLRPGTYYIVDNQSDGETPYARSGGIRRFEVTGPAADADLPATDATVTATDYAFDVSGIEAGTNRLTFDNTGRQLHHAVALPIVGGATIADVKRFMGVAGGGGEGGTGTADGGKAPKQPVDFQRAVSTAVLDGGQRQVIELDFDEGRYALICAIANRNGGPLHFQRGMVGEFDTE